MATSKEVFALEYKFGGNVEFLTKIEQLLQRMEKSFKATETDAKKAGTGMSDAFDKASRSAAKLDSENKKLGQGFASLTGKVKGFIAAYAGISGLSRSVSFATGSMDLADVQSRSERQLKLVMDNMGSGAAFDAIKREASAIQGRTVYGDEAMIAGAGELATYVKDPAAMKRMMNILADYAAGMTGGGEVGAQQMVQLATGLGMAIDGNYRALRMKGFDTSALENLKENATDAQKVEALAKSLETWNGLSAEMAKDPSAAAIRFKNKLGDLREELGKRLYPVYNKMIESLDRNLPKIEKMMDSVGGVAGKLFDTVSNNVDSIMKLGDGVGRLAEKLVGLLDVVTPIVAKLMEIPGLCESIMAALAVEKLSGISGGIGLISGGFHSLEKALRRTNRELLTMGKNGKVAAKGIAALMAGGVAGFISDTQTSGGVVANGLSTGGTVLAMTGNPLLAGMATVGSFGGSIVNAAYKEATYDYGSDEKRNAEIEKRGKYGAMLSKAYHRAKKSGNEKDIYELNRAMSLYAKEYGDKSAKEALYGIAGYNESAEAKSTTVNNTTNNNTSITQNNTIGAEFSQLGTLIRQNLVELMERNLKFDTSMAMEVAGV